MTTTYSQGEWLAKKRPMVNTGNIEVACGDNLVAVVACKDWHYGSICTPEETRANAELIASAPDLLDLLYRCLPFIEDAKTDPAYKRESVAKLEKEIRNTIKKAEGK